MKSINNILSSHYVVGRHYVHTDKFNDKFKELIDKSEVVVVNGEGTIHHQNRAGTVLMDILKYAQDTNKKTMLINTVLDFPAPYYNEVFKKLDYLSVREILSYDKAKQCGGNPEVLLDSCVDPINFTDKNVLVQDTRGLTLKGNAHPGVSEYAILKTIDLPILAFKRIFTFNTIVKSLKNARVYVTGQHHGIYAAGLAGIPFVPLSSNSHKIEGLIKWSGLPIKICRNRNDIMEQIRFASNKDNKHIYDDFHKFITSGNFLNKEKMEKLLNEI